MLCRHIDFDCRLIKVFEVDGDFNGVDAIKKASYLFGFLNNNGLVFWLEMTMTSGNIDLHWKLQRTGLLKIGGLRKSLLPASSLARRIVPLLDHAHKSQSGNKKGLGIPRPPYLKYSVQFIKPGEAALLGSNLLEFGLVIGFFAEELRDLVFVSHLLSFCLAIATAERDCCSLELDFLLCV